jgi:hypothetical protein
MLFARCLAASRMNSDSVSPRTPAARLARTQSGTGTETLTIARGMAAGLLLRGIDRVSCL